MIFESYLNCGILLHIIKIWTVKVFKHQQLKENKMIFLKENTSMIVAISLLLFGITGILNTSAQTETITLKLFTIQI